MRKKDQRYRWCSNRQSMLAVDVDLESQHRRKREYQIDVVVTVSVEEERSTLAAEEFVDAENREAGAGNKRMVQQEVKERAAAKTPYQHQYIEDKLIHSIIKMHLQSINKQLVKPQKCCKKP